MIRVLQFAGLVNRHDFIDAIVQQADRDKFEIGVCVGSELANISPPVYSPWTPHWTLGDVCRRRIPFLAVELARILRKWKADVLHTHHYNEALIGMLATRLNPKTRLVVGRHYSDAIYRSSSGWRKRALLAGEHAVNRFATRIVAPSQFISEILTQWQGISREKVDIVPYGFVAEKYSLPSVDEVSRVRTEFGLDGDFVIGTFGRLHEEKGHRHLIDSLSLLRPRLPNLRLIIVGEGPERTELERRVQAAGLTDVVRFLGWRRDTMTLMSSVDIVVQPTLQEAFSQVMAEALWLGKPLVITDVSGARDVINHGHNGLIVPRGDLAALSQAVELVYKDQALRAQFAREGKSFVSNNLDIRTVVKQYERTYERALAARKS